MRIAVLIIGLMLSVGLFIQSLVANVGSGLNNSDSLGAAAAAGVLMALMWIVASALVMPLPRVSVVIFLLAAALGFGFGAGSEFKDLYFWGSVSVLLAVFSFFGFRGKKNSQAKEAARDAAQSQLMRRLSEMQGVAPDLQAPLAAAPAGVGAAGPSGSFARPSNRKLCPNCGADMPVTAKMCSDCRHQFSV
jgi:hypothetical protein